MNKNFSYYLSEFLKKYLIIERNLSSNTIKSYKKTFQILIEYLVNEKDFKLSQITFENITREIIIEFLKYLEDNKKNSIRTRNQRLAAIKSFYQFCLIDEIENVDNINKILSIKFKKFPQKVVDYLTEEELQKLLQCIDTTTIIGRRDLVLLTLLYDTAARASEIINLKIEDIRLSENYVILTGKGNKQRVVPIMNKTKELLIRYIKENNLHGTLFKDNSTYELIRYIINKYNNFTNKNITPHTFRHTRAIHWLKAGISLIQIRDLLGHSSITTTEVYAKVLNEDKFKALEKINSNAINTDLKDWNDDQDLLNQLINL